MATVRVVVLATPGGGPGDPGEALVAFTREGRHGALTISVSDTAPRSALVSLAYNVGIVDGSTRGTAFRDRLWSWDEMATQFARMAGEFGYVARSADLELDREYAVAELDSMVRLHNELDHSGPFDFGM